MQIFSFIHFLALLSAQLYSVRAIPLQENSPAAYLGVEISKRAPGDTADEAIETIMDCTKIPEVCEADCMAILCYNAPQVMQRDMGAGREHYTQSGAGLRPFKDAKNMQKRGLSIPDASYNSAEETSYQSTTQGGPNCIIVPVPFDQQNIQGGLLNGMYNRHGVENRMWFKQLFGGLSSLTPYCNALMSNPPDRSICNKKLDQKIDLKQYAFLRNEGPGFVTFKNLFPGFSKRDYDDEDIDELYEESKRDLLSYTEDDEDGNDLELNPSLLYTPEELGY